MKTYLELLRTVRHQGTDKGDRTGTGTRSLFGYQMRFDLERGYPLLTTKRVFFKAVAHELLWFLRGESNLAYLQQHGITIWDEWADDDGELGPIYGCQWRSWRTADGDAVDQISRVLADLRSDPDSRRHIVSAWNVGELDAMALPPCHVLFQLYVGDGRLSCHLYQRSADVFLGLPFNIASYSLLTLMMARVLGLAPGDLVLSLGDVHLYRNHFEQADIQLSREPRPLPTLHLDREVKDLFAFEFGHFELEDYHPYPRIPAPIAV